MISSQELDQPNPQIFEDVFKGVREGDPKALMRAYEQTQEGNPLRQAVEHIIFVDSHYFEAPQTQ